MPRPFLLVPPFFIAIVVNCGLSMLRPYGQHIHNILKCNNHAVATSTIHLLAGPHRGSMAMPCNPFLQPLISRFTTKSATVLPRALSVMILV
jgi:hypothetical protein